MGEQTIIAVFGKTSAGKWHGGRFDAEQAEIVITAAESSGWRVFRPWGEDASETARHLQKGSLAKDGKMDLPMISRQLYVTLTKLADAEEAATSACGDSSAKPSPSSGSSSDPWDEIGVNSVVLGQAADEEGEGWWEARVMAIELNGKLKLVYSDYPEEGEFWMNRRAVGLFWPGLKR